MSRKTSSEIAAEIRSVLKAHRKAVCRVNTRVEMDMVLEHLTYEEKERVRFRFND